MNPVIAILSWFGCLLAYSACISAPPVAHIDIPEIKTAEQKADLARSFEAESYIVVEGVTLWAGELQNVLTGEFPELDEPLSGAFLNTGKIPVVLQDPQGNMILALPGSMVFAEFDRVLDESTGGVHCRAECGSGYYACCNYGTNGQRPTCRCVQVSQGAACAVGGSGSTACEISQ